MGYPNYTTGLSNAPVASIAEKQATAADEMCHQLDAMIGGAEQTLNRLCTISDRALGQIPPEPVPATKRPEPSGMVGLIADKLVRLGELQELQRRQVERLEQVF